MRMKNRFHVNGFAFSLSLQFRARFFLRILGFNDAQTSTATLNVLPQGAHTIGLCSRLLFYSKCTGFTVCFTYSDISITMYINQ